MKKKAAAGKGREALVVGSKVKGYIKSKKFKCSGELLDALSDTVRRKLDGAMKRCEGNKRSTVRPVDL
jgi:hypothetical protein